MTLLPASEPAGPATLTTLDFVRFYRANEWKPIPLNGKVPVTKEWQRLDLPPEQDERHFGNGQNVGLRLGSPSGGLVDIDIDDEVALRIASYFLPVSSFIFGRVSKPNSHWMYIVDPVPKTSRFQCPDGRVLIEVRSTGAQTMAPPSKHPEGELVSFAHSNGALPGPPSIVHADTLMLAVGRVAAAALLAKNLSEKGSRQDATLALAGGLLRAGWGEEEVRIFIRAITDGVDDEEASLRQSVVRSTMQKIQAGSDVRGWPSLAELVGDKVVQKACNWLGAKTDGIKVPQRSVAPDHDEFHCTDSGNARRFAVRFGSELKYVTHGKRGGSWSGWDGTKWHPDLQAAERAAKNVARELYQEASLGDSLGKRTQLAKWALCSESAERITAMLRLAQSEHEITAKPSEFDQQPWLLNVSNGVLDLRTSTLIPHNRELKLTKLAGTGYDAQAKCPRWDRFLLEIMDGKEELVTFLQRSVGYSLSGQTSEQYFFFCYGPGANGKTTFLEIIRDILGGYGQQAEFSTFLRKAHGSDGPRNDIANLQGARLVVAAELAGGRQFDESVLKQLTGGDSVRARYLYADEFEFRPEFKLWLAANQLPKLRPDHAMMRRIALIPFDVIIPRQNQDKHLSERLREELPGILAWAVRGHVMWKLQGLNVPQAVHNAVADYRAENDPISPFVEDCCELADKAETQASGLYSAYKNWWLENPGKRSASLQVESQRWFGERLADIGRLRRRKTRSGIVWDGIGLKQTRE